MCYRVTLLAVIFLVTVSAALRLPRHVARRLENSDGKVINRATSTLCDTSLSFEELVLSVPGTRAISFIQNLKNHRSCLALLWASGLVFEDRSYRNN